MWLKHEKEIGAILVAIGLISVAGTTGGIEGYIIDLIPGILMYIIGFLIIFLGLNLLDEI